MGVLFTLPAYLLSLVFNLHNIHLFMRFSLMHAHDHLLQQEQVSDVSLSGDPGELPLCRIIS